MELDFEPQAQPDVPAFDVLPAGDYTLLAESEEYKISQKNDQNAYVKYTFVVVEDAYGGRYKNRKVWVNFNFWNTNPEAVARSRSEFKQLCAAVGVPNTRNTADVLMRPFTAKVTVRAGKDGNDPQNQVRDYRPAGSLASSRTGQPGARPPISAPGAHAAQAQAAQAQRPPAAPPGGFQRPPAAPPAAHAQTAPPANPGAPAWVQQGQGG